MKRILLAPDSFKGTISAREVCRIEAAVIRRVAPRIQVDCLPLSDGGEGMAECCQNLFGGTAVTASVTGPLGNPVAARYALLPDGRAAMEMASAAGLSLAARALDPLRATTFGVGELLLDAKRRGVSSVLLGLGGSATTDGGIGMAAALGYRFWDVFGRELPPYAENLQRIQRIEPPADPISLCVNAACDVTNPLFGANGAAPVFSPQKGADANTAAFLDAGLCHLAEIIFRDLGVDVSTAPGAGAAGGLGAGVLAFLSGTLCPGVDLLLDACHFSDRLASCDLVITGEGRLDGQSAHGKLVSGVAQRAKSSGVPCIALCGSQGPGYEALFPLGVTKAVFSAAPERDFVSIQRTCREDLRRATEALMAHLLSPD